MAVESGLGAVISIDDSGGTARALGPYCTSLTINTSRGQQDISSIDKSGMSRLLLRSDCQFQGTFVFDDTANLTFDVFKTAGTYDSTRTVTFTHSGQVLSVECILSSVSLSVGADGALSYSVTLDLANGTDPTWS